MSRILLVDDDTDMLKLMERWFEKAGYEVYTAASGRDALLTLETVRPDLVLLDYAMPEMDGLEVLSRIRENEAIKDIPVLFRTGMEGMETAGIMDGLKPDGVISKAAGKPQLLQAVADILKRG